MNLFYAGSSYPMGALSDSIDRRLVVGVGFGVLIVADLVLAFAAGPWVALLGIALWGLHMGMTQGLLGALVADTAPDALRGTAFGVFHLVSGIAMLIASVVAGELWERLGTPGDVPRRDRLHLGRPHGDAGHEEANLAGKDLADSWRRLANAPRRAEVSIDDGQHEQREQRRRDEAADDDRGERALHLAARRGRERHRHEAERRDERGHEHRPQAELGRAADGLDVADALVFELARERHEHEAVQHRDAEERDEADAGRDRERDVAERRARRRRRRPRTARSGR